MAHNHDARRPHDHHARRHNQRQPPDGRDLIAHLDATEPKHCQGPLLHRDCARGPFCPTQAASGDGDVAPGAPDTLAPRGRGPPPHALGEAADMFRSRLAADSPVAIRADMPQAAPSWRTASLEASPDGGLDATGLWPTSEGLQGKSWTHASPAARIAGGSGRLQSRARPPHAPHTPTQGPGRRGPLRARRPAGDYAHRGCRAHPQRLSVPPHTCGGNAAARPTRAPATAPTKSPRFCSSASATSTAHS